MRSFRPHSYSRDFVSHSYFQRISALGLIEHLRTRLTKVATSVDQGKPKNQYLEIDEKGEPSLKRLKAKAAPRGLKQLEEALQEKIPERHLLDILARINIITNFTCHFGPLSGNGVYGAMEQESGLGDSVKTGI